MADGVHVCRRTGIFSVLAQLDIDGNILTQVLKKNPPSGLGGDAISKTCLQTDGRTDGDPRPEELIRWIASLFRLSLSVMKVLIKPTFARLHPKFKWGTNFCRSFFLSFLLLFFNMCNIITGTVVYIIESKITIWKETFYCGTNFRNTL